MSDASTVPSIPYEHEQFPAGLTVFIDPAIRDIHLECPVAGQIMQTCRGLYAPVIEPMSHMLSRVPLTWGNSIYYAEEAYVSLAQPESK